MQRINNIRYRLRSLSVVLLTAFSLLSCYDRLSGPAGAKDLLTPTEYHNINTEYHNINTEYHNINKQPAHWNIVIVHGMGTPDSESIRNFAYQVFGCINQSNTERIDIIALSRPNSITGSMEEQVRVTYNQLTAELAKKGQLESNIILIGDSQGGTLALELYRMAKDQLNIKGIITHQSPLGGLNVNGIKGLRQSIDGILPNDNLKKLANTVLKLDFLDRFDGPGVSDLDSNSACIKRVKQTLETATIPILIIAGRSRFPLAALVATCMVQAGDRTIPDLNYLDNQLSNKLNIKLWLLKLDGKTLAEKLLPAYLGSEHDGLISYTSQLGCDSATGSLIQNPCITRYSYPYDRCHVSPIAEGEAFEQVKRFIDELRKKELVQRI